MKQPEWCPHKDCILLAHSQSMMCIGKLPKLETHDGGINTHRFCLDTRETGHEIFDLRINRGDSWNMIRLLKLVLE